MKNDKDYMFVGGMLTTLLIVLIAGAAYSAGSDNAKEEIISKLRICINHPMTVEECIEGKSK